MNNADPRSLGVVYVLTNPAMPGLVKIGYTSREEVEMRIAELYSTGVPVPFEVAIAVTVDRASEVEKALHTAFGPSRLNSKREFFTINPDQAIAILQLFQKDDLTNSVIVETNKRVDEISNQARTALRKKRRPNMNFDEMQIPNGSELRFTQGEVVAIVTGPKTVKLEGGEDEYMTPLTKRLLGSESDIQPSAFWTYNGRLLKEIYEETYVDSSD